MLSVSEGWFGRRQGAQILRNEASLTYASLTKDAAQSRDARDIRIFYEVVKVGLR